MILGKIARSASTPLGTPGHLILDNGFQCDTLELPWKENKKGVSCTIADTYKGWVWMSPMLKRLVIRLEDKHGRHDCLIHNGNFAAEERDIDGDGVAEITQIHGCTEVGKGYGEIMRKDGLKQWGILNSGKALDALIESLEDPEQPGGFDRVEITYRWAEGCYPSQVDR